MSPRLGFQAVLGHQSCAPALVAQNKCSISWAFSSVRNDAKPHHFCKATGAGEKASFWSPGQQVHEQNSEKICWQRAIQTSYDKPGVSPALHGPVRHRELQEVLPQLQMQGQSRHSQHQRQHTRGHLCTAKAPSNLQLPPACSRQSQNLENKT